MLDLLLPVSLAIFAVVGVIGGQDRVLQPQQPRPVADRDAAAPSATPDAQAALEEQLELPLFEDTTPISAPPPFSEGTPVMALDDTDVSNIFSDVELNTVDDSQILYVAPGIDTLHGPVTIEALRDQDAVHIVVAEASETDRVTARLSRNGTDTEILLNGEVVTILANKVTLGPRQVIFAPLAIKQATDRLEVDGDLFVKVQDKPQSNLGRQAALSTHHPSIN